jgi:phage terminase large subunit
MIKTAFQQQFRLTLSTLNVDVPRALVPLLKPARYKAAYGGRGGAKSHFFAEQIILRCYSRPTRAVCIREVQNSLKESVRQLLVDKIQKFGLGWAFDVLESEIRGVAGTPAAGSLIIFKGMQSYNAENIKSLEDYDIAWVEEAQTLSDRSLRLLRPTIRKDGSEIWASWNPRYETDAIDAFFRGETPPDNAMIVSVNWWDNPWFPKVLLEEKEFDFKADAEMAEHVWNGGYEIITEGAYYARYIAQAENEGRIGYFPYDPNFPVYTSWDIGVDDYTAIWFWQRDDEKAWVIDYFEYSGAGPDTIVPHCMPELCPSPAEQQAGLIEIERVEPFWYGGHYLPHDVKVREWGSGGRQRSLTLMGYGVKPILVGVSADPLQRVDASRALLPLTRFNRTKRVMHGVMRLRRYSRKMNDQLGTYTTPLHDMNSHGSDAFGEFAINCPLIKKEPEKPKGPPQPRGTVMIGPPEPVNKKRIVI